MMAAMLAASRLVIAQVLSLVALNGCESAARTEQPRAPLVPPGERVFVSNEIAGTVSVIDAENDRVVGAIHVGKRPRGLRLSPDGKLLYVALSGSPRGGPGVDESKLPPPDRAADGIGVVDVESLRLLRTLKSGPDPECFDISPDGQRILVSNEDSARVSLIDLSGTNTAASFPVGGEPEGVAIRPDGKIGYVTSEAMHRVDVIDLESHQVVASIPSARRPRTVLFTRDGSRAFVTGELGKAVDVMDGITHQSIGQIAVGGPEPALPMGLALAPDERSLYVTTGRGGAVAVIDVALRSVRRIIEGVGARPWGIGVTRDGKKIYTANGSSNDVSVIDMESGTIVRRLNTGASPWGIATLSPKR
jgi:YVTN family beta-propeller protein